MTKNAARKLRDWPQPRQDFPDDYNYFGEPTRGSWVASESREPSKVKPLVGGPQLRVMQLIQGKIGK